ncbi:uncharacterized protein LOC114252493 [Bombyx mandarina]|uniref:Uncharacterized protein LOC114252493 n=1 Tax=Bombyx mandarina TaxID=7092 RepID=A0A6J2KKW6_BOMMA|nr:uncharacterized protein LOC114252493 [Bombyx mandarina]
MDCKIITILCYLAVARASIIDTDYPPAASVSYSSISTPINGKTIINPSTEVRRRINFYKTVEPAPVHETFSDHNNAGNAYFSSLHKQNLDYYNHQNYDTPVYLNTYQHEPIGFNPHENINVHGPLVHSVSTLAAHKSIPVTFATHSIPYSKTSYLSDTRSALTEPSLFAQSGQSSGLSAYSSYTPLSYLPSKSSAVYPKISGVKSYDIYSPPINTPSYESHPGTSLKNTLTYSEAPLVSHLSFNAHGASYSW